MRPRPAVFLFVRCRPTPRKKNKTTILPRFVVTAFKLSRSRFWRFSFRLCESHSWPLSFKCQLCFVAFCFLFSWPVNLRRTRSLKSLDDLELDMSELLAKAGVVTQMSLKSSGLIKAECFTWWQWIESFLIFFLWSKNFWYYLNLRHEDATRTERIL
jgi:hypothetical protein